MLDINLITLSFQDARLERHYRSSYSRRYRFQSLLAMKVALLLFSVFALLDWLLYPQLVNQLWSIRFGFALPALLLIFVFMSGQAYFRHGQQLMALSLIVANVAIVVMIVVIPTDMNDVYVAGLMLVALYGYTVARLRIVWASLGNWSGVLAYNLAHIWWGDASTWDLIAGNFFCIATNVLGMVANYSLEYDSRRGFLLRQDLRRERSRLSTVNKRLQKQSLTDDLTLLANRRNFFSHFQEEWRRAKRKHQFLSLIMIDLDHFKRVNDQHGHQAGDQCLQQVAQILASHARRAGEMAARFGGEEFVLLLPGLSPDLACEIAETVRSDIAATAFSIAPQTISNGLRLTISCGVACAIPDAENTLENLLLKADQAMYEVKRQGRNGVICADVSFAGEKNQA